MSDLDEILRKLSHDLGLPAEALAQISDVVATHTLRAATIPIETASSPHEVSPAAPGLVDPVVASPWDRYDDLGALGRGGMGEVRLVRDRVLGRELAMKILSPEVAGEPEATARFLAEARLSAQLQHPGIVPVHDCGALPGGLLWFTMKRVRGRTLSGVIQALHAGVDTGPSPEARGRVIDAYARTCEAVAYAHGVGIIHRDLKPENIMLGELGEVLVMDWGIALASADLARDAKRVCGTPAYMAPEQALGAIDRIGKASDVYALGAVLFAILCGEAPYSGTPAAVRAQVIHGPPEPLAARGGGPHPEDLVAICERAMARRPEDRPRDARALAEEVRGYLDGARRRERARNLVREAHAMLPQIEASRARAGGLTADAKATLARIEPWEPEAEKARGWALEDEARALDRAVTLESVAWEQKVRAALLEAPDLEEAHEALADAHLTELLAAEEARDAEAAARAESLLRPHARGRHATLLRGDGSLTLHTAPDGASVRLLRYVERNRRLCAEPVAELGPTTLREMSLPRGSYLLSIRAPGYREMRYPLWIGRGQHREIVRPGSTRPFAIPLLREGELGEDDVYVPAGWFRSGGDARASESLPSRRLWVDGFVMKRHPVTQAEYLVFLNDLVSTDRVAEAEAACPRAGQAVAGNANVPLFVRGKEGRFELEPHAPPEQARYPVSSMSWHDAMAYAAWVSRRTWEAWRLAGEQEREKAARGADGRFFPWGDQPETTWACMVSSRPGPASMAEVDAFPTDESPCGVRGLSGNVRDWCVETWTPEGSPTRDGLVLVQPAASGDPGLRSIRGGAWSSAPPALCRATGRFAARPEERFRAVGLRLVRPVEAEADARRPR